MVRVNLVNNIKSYNIKSNQLVSERIFAKMEEYEIFLFGLDLFACILERSLLNCD